MDLVDGTLPSSSEKLSFIRHSDKPPFTVIQFLEAHYSSSSGVQKSCSAQRLEHRRNIHFHFFDRDRVQMSTHSSNPLTPTSRIMVVARHPQGLGLVPTTCQVIALSTQFIVLMTHNTIL
jgi:hypothetical protein